MHPYHQLADYEILADYDVASAPPAPPAPPPSAPDPVPAQAAPQSGDPAADPPLPVPASDQSQVSATARALTGDLGDKLDGAIAKINAADEASANPSAEAEAGPKGAVPVPPPDGPFQLRTQEGNVVTVTASGGKNGDGSYDFDLTETGGVSTHVHLDADAAQDNALGASTETPDQVASRKLSAVAGYLADEPPQVASTVKTVNLHESPSPDEAYWQKQLNDPKFQVGATGGGGTIDFYRGTLDRGTLDHEAAHDFASSYMNSVDPKQGNDHGQAWDHAIQDDGAAAQAAGRGDGGYPSAYGKEIKDSTDSDGEDFAESFRLYQAAKAAGPDALDQFRQQYPNRAKLLDSWVGGNQLPPDHGPGGAQ